MLKMGVAFIISASPTGCPESFDPLLYANILPSDLLKPVQPDAAC
jgi:hypothetical protein